jgi:lipoprotein-anchoring transpeptidase ErfK/SrfK
MVSATRPITGEQTVLPVIAHATGAHDAAWLRVLLPGRPNGHTGWISARSTTAALTRWRIIIRISTRQVTAYWDGRPAHTFTAVVGKPSTPTPLGRFFVEETVKLDPLAVGAPYALALSARSNVLQEFDGGPGQIALHGTNNIGGVLGTAASHGCIRLDTQAITWLATRIGPGIPVTITP